MKYYKLLDNRQFVGVITSDDFLRYQVKNAFLQHVDETKGEYVNCGGQLYRSTWLRPVKENGPAYITVSIEEITEEEYRSFVQAIETNEEIPDEEEVVLLPQSVILEEDNTVEFVKDAKLREMSATCRRTIENGFDLELRGETSHFSLTTQDQLNLMGLSAMAQTQELIPYHADGELCVFYTAAEINEIVAAATQFKNYQTAYHNALKAYINALETIEEISAITYGTEIPDEYKSDVLKILE